MQQAIQIHADNDVGAVRYNPAESAFEALVTVPTDRGPVRVASSYEAPVSTSEWAAIAGLRREAIRSLDQPGTIRSYVAPEEDETAPAGVVAPIQRFFGQLFGNRAA
ncbi:hypothetical protein ROJ8625_03143 [Roseivivax jejudonensis]|uniref:Uncharacterized protein n=1 Tax=Roseivivax jejudonensis TaxID=1529041 RepID=A0A1X6ZU06_9RHOB|nr:hypothetical protein [Roseivivax jejudonensis]SLN61595.1 hypothetical protein ROJ8625_03143 [Roseivivax jejudonensis]